MTNEGPKGIKFENPDDQETVLFRDFIKENNYTADQMREAYYRLVGVEEEGEPTSEVAAILGKMQEMVAKDFPLNRFAKLIEARQIYEDPLPVYNNYIESLKISEKEKGVLRSIVDRERNGEVVCLSKTDGNTIGEFKINVKKYGQAVAIVLITQCIEKILEEVREGEKYEFNFIEL